MKLYCTHPAVVDGFERNRSCLLCGAQWCKDDKAPTVCIATSNLAKNGIKDKTARRKN